MPLLMEWDLVIVSHVFIVNIVPNKPSILVVIPLLIEIEIVITMFLLYSALCNLSHCFLCKWLLLYCFFTHKYRVHCERWGLFWLLSVSRYKERHQGEEWSERRVKERKGKPKNWRLVRFDWESVFAFHQLSTLTNDSSDGVVIKHLWVHFLNHMVDQASDVVCCDLFEWILNVIDEKSYFSVPPWIRWQQMEWRWNAWLDCRICLALIPFFSTFMFFLFFQWWVDWLSFSFGCSCSTSSVPRTTSSAVLIAPVAFAAPAVHVVTTLPVVKTNASLFSREEMSTKWIVFEDIGNPVRKISQRNGIVLQKRGSHEKDFAKHCMLCAWKKGKQMENLWKFLINDSHQSCRWSITIVSETDEKSK